jgi:hypothetical protein
MSGGLDSEYVARVFLSLGMQFEPVIMHTDFNHADRAWAHKFCTAMNLKPLIVDLDYTWFVEHQMLDIMTQAELALFGSASNLWLAEQLTGTVITGDAPPYLRRVNDSWLIVDEEYIGAQMRYWAERRLEGTPLFMTYTPEQYLSFLLDPSIEKLAADLIPGKLGSNSTKVLVFNNQEEFVLEPRTKQTGYELVHSSALWQHKNMQLANHWLETKWGGAYTIEYKEMVRLLES